MAGEALRNLVGRPRASRSARSGEAARRALGTLSGALLGGLALAPGAGAHQDGAGARFALPPGAAREAVLAVPPDQVPAKLDGAPWPIWEDAGPGGWGSPGPWLRWAALVRAEAAATTPDPLRRAQLALCARAQGRDHDAWDHLAACAADPAVVAALLPSFLPGATPGTAALPGGLPAGLEDGALLRPPLPPAITDAVANANGITAPRLELSEFTVGETHLSFALELSVDGVEVTLKHLAGPPVTLRVAMPSLRRQAIRSLYADWYRVDDPSSPVELHLTAEDPEHQVWGRFFPRTIRWPMLLPGGVDARVARGEVRVESEDRAPVVTGFAAGLSALLATPCPVVASDPDDAGEDTEPLVLRFPAGPDRDAKLTSMVSLAEAYALRPPSPMAPAPDDR